jgi:hypothetical protein
MRVLEHLAAEAIRLGFDTLEVEYKDGFEEVCGLKGGVGFGIARFKSGTSEARVLREELYGTTKSPRRLTLGSDEFSLRGSVWDSFGEDAFRVTLRRVRRDALTGPRGKVSRRRSQG